ncbi:hypothetical protein ACHAQJ_010080 [Trichoderma viride]
MADSLATKDDMTVRRRKTHRKSRLGCGNCKIRSVKCDEAKPTCRRCQSSGFTCNYSGTIPTLELSHSRVFRLNLARTEAGPVDNLLADGISIGASLQPGLQIPIILPLQGRLGDYTLRPGDYAALGRFQDRTVATLGIASTRWWYFRIVSSLAKEHPFLFHVFLTITLLHDYHLSPNPLPPSHESSLAFHWYHGAAILKHFLAFPSPSTTLSSSHRDALWICATILGATSFASIRTQDPHAAWPLADPDPAIDLDWLKMGYGKKVVWDITDPSRPESVFHNLLRNTPMEQPLHHMALINPDTLPPLFYSLFNLSPSTSSVDTNPYHSPCSILSFLCNTEIDDSNMIVYLTFITHIDPHYRCLVEEKDPRALLLLLYWHSIVVSHDRWWLRRRCAVEAKAICMYLDKYYEDNDDIMELLQVPKERLAKEVVVV